MVFRKFARCDNLAKHPTMGDCVDEIREKKRAIGRQFTTAAGDKKFQMFSLLRLRCTYDLCDARFFHDVSLRDHVNYVHHGQV